MRTESVGSVAMLSVGEEQTPDTAERNLSQMSHRFEDHLPSFVARTHRQTDSVSTIPSDLDSVNADSEGGESFLGCSEHFLNVLLLGIGFMFSVGALQTCSMAQTVILHSVQDAYFNGTATIGYTCLAINCAAQALAYLFGASVCAVVGPKLALVSGSVCISLYISCYLRPLAATIYAGSVLVGLGSGTMWAVQGHFVASNSRKDTVERNMAIFWGLLQSSSILGSLFYFLMLRGAENIETRTRLIVISVLLVASLIGIGVFSLIRQPWMAKLARPGANSERWDVSPLGPKDALVGTIRMGMRKDMLWLIPHFFYIGLECTMWASVYSTSLGYTLAFGTMRQSLVGLNGVFLGLGEISASIVLSCLGKWTSKRGKDLLLIFGMMVHFTAFYLIYLNIPENAPLGPTENDSFIGPNPYLAMFCTVLLGIGDAVWTNQLMSYLGCAFPYDCVAAFGVYQFWTAITNSASFFYSTVLTLPFQLLLLTFTAIPAAAGFCLAEWRSTKV